MGVRERIRKLDFLSERCDAVVIVNLEEPDPNFVFFTGVDPSFSALVYDFKKPVIVSNKMERRKAEKNRLGAEVVEPDYLKEFRGAKIGVNSDFLPSNRLKGFRKIDISGELEKLRAVKTAAEIRCIERASRAVLRCFEELRPRAGVRESEIKSEISSLLYCEGCEPEEILVLSGPKSSFPHGIPGDRTVRSGEPVVVDIVASFRFYCADFTRTFFAKPRIENLVRRALSAVEGAALPGAKTVEVEREARRVFGKRSGRMIHSIGHGIGISVHELPVFSKGVLEPGMTFTLEPGLYFRRHGIRIENTYLLTRKGVKILG